MIAGNILALLQRNIKRLLAYSSIAHLGYLLVAFLPGNEAGVEAAVFYLLAYSITILAAFGVVTLLSNRQRDAEDVESYRGLFWREPVMATVLTFALLSLAGIPLTAGFIGKFYVLVSGVEQALWLPVLTLVLTSVFGAFYYLRVISYLFAESAPALANENRLHPFFYFGTYTALITLTVLLIGLCVYPNIAIDSIKSFLLIK